MLLKCLWTKKHVNGSNPDTHTPKQTQLVKSEFNWMTQCFEENPLELTPNRKVEQRAALT